jgi:PKD repeat protein
MDTQFSAPGMVVTHTLRVTNTGDLPDTFTLLKNGNVWTTDVPISVGPLYPGESADVQVLVHIPSNAASGATDVVTISVFYHPPGSLLLLGDTSVLTTTAVVTCIPVTSITFTYAPLNPVIQSPVAFTATIAPSNATALIAYTWDFGDGYGGSGQAVSHPYALGDTYTVIVTATNCMGTGIATYTEEVAVTLVDGAQTVVDPTLGGTLIYTDAQGNPTTVKVPGGATTETITLLLTPVASPTQLVSPNLRFINHTFDLEAYVGDRPVSGYVFSRPVTITVQYSDADVAGVDEENLRLRYWTGSVWDDAANTCTPPSTYTRDLVQNVLGVPVCHLSRFSVVGQSLNTIYLPAVLRQS